jgi:hypothetical protein
VSRITLFYGKNSKKWSVEKIKLTRSQSEKKGFQTKHSRNNQHLKNPLKEKDHKN